MQVMEGSPHCLLSHHLEPDTLECEVKWALGSITTNKASGGGALGRQPGPACCS